MARILGFRNERPVGYDFLSLSLSRAKFISLDDTVHKFLVGA